MADWFVEILTWFGRHSAWLLLPAVAIIFTWVLEAKVRKDSRKEDWEKGVNVSNLVKVFAFIGMIYGFFLMIGAIMMEITGYSPSLMFKEVQGGGENVVNHFTTIIYFTTGMVMFFKPLKDIPFASLVALAVASVVTIISMWVIPENAIGELVIDYVLPLRWLLIIIFIVVLAITYSVSRVSFNLMTSFSKLISKPIFSIIYGGFVLVQAIMLLFGYSIVLW